MTRIDVILIILLICVVCTMVLIVLRRCISWTPARRFMNVLIALVLIFLTMMFLSSTVGYNSYDRAFNTAVAQYFNVPSEEKHVNLVKETKRKKRDEDVANIATGSVLAFCLLATYLFRIKQPKQDAPKEQ